MLMLSNRSECVLPQSPSWIIKRAFVFASGEGVHYSGRQFSWGSAAPSVVENPNETNEAWVGRSADAPLTSVNAF